MSITNIIHNGTGYQFTAGKSVYHCDDRPSLEEVRQELMAQAKQKDK